MKLNVYAIFDVKAGNYATPFFMQRDAMADRAFSDLVNDARSTINKHPGDYSLFKIAVFDDNSSEIKSCKPEQIVQGASCVVPNQPALPQMAGLAGPPAELSKNGQIKS